MYSNLDTNEYLKYKKEGIVGSVTRGLVVSTEDPLMAGRVKVWIPAIHGGNAGSSIKEQVFFSDLTGEDSDKNNTNFSNLIDKFGNLDQTIVNALPWAYVLGHNWGPTGTPIGTDINIFTGIFNVPKTGTEVIVIFEQDDPNFPIIIGSVFHSNEFSTFLPRKTLEIAPGIPVNYSPTTLNKYNYSAEVSNSFIIRSNNNSTLAISDVTGQEQIILSKEIPFTQISEMTSEMYSNYAVGYPNFPSTASSPLNITRSLLHPLGSSSIPSLQTDNNSDTSAIPGNISVIPGEASGTKVLTKCYPTTYKFPTPTKHQLFRSGRPVQGTPTRLHMGVDLGIPIGSNIIAPINGIPVYYRETSTAGIILLFKGLDGIGHTFAHLSAIDPKIKEQIDSGNTDIINPGTILALSGNTGTDSTGAHLHWETFPGANAAITGAELYSLRNLCQSPGGGTFKGVKIPGYSCINPLEWISGGQTNSQIILPADQVAQFVESANLLSSSSNRNIGLEMSVTPGMETVMLRHPSGGFIGFDIDGNLQIFTTGDLNIKVNRSVNVDILGAIVTTCLGIYTRAQAIIKTMTKSYKLLNWKDRSNNGAISGFPDIMETMETQRIQDNNDALIAANNNTFYISPITNEAILASTIASTGILTQSNSSTTSINAPSSNDFDLYLAKAYLKYIENNNKIPSELKKYFNIKKLKSVMLKESSGNPNAGSAGSVGLFQITDFGYSEITGSTGNDLNFLKDPAKNIDAGVNIISNYVTKIYNKYISLNTTVTPNTFIDLGRMALFSYNTGITECFKLMISISRDNKQISYILIETYYNDLSTDKNKNIHLQYVPLVEKIYGTVQLSKSESELISEAMNS